MNTTYINKPDILKWYIYKILLIMRLTTVILMVSMLQVSASTVAQEFTYVKKGASLIQIFKEIKKQTGYNIIWNEKKIDVSTTIDANFKKATIHDVLNKCLSNLPLSYSINNKMVMIKEEEPSFRKKLLDFFNSIDVRGRVVDENNQPLAGATVRIKGTKISTSTDTNGEFLLNLVGDKATLVISFLGYETKEISATENIGTIKLILKTDKLEEVKINTGYYTVEERERTGSISRITSKDIEKQPVNNVLAAMQANIPGVQITQTSGVPGGGFTVRIRGQNSISRGNEPFYIIDGIPFNANGIAGTRSVDITNNASPLASINPADIESIEVLKDADATSIYGSRGANGVILITLKRGKVGQAKTSFSLNQGISRVGKKLELMDVEQYLTMRREALNNDGLPISSTDYDLNGTWSADRDVDWQKELIGKAAPTTNLLASLSGGTGNLNYLIGGNYYKEETVFPGESFYRRASGTFSLQYVSANKKLNTSFNANYSQITSNLFITDLTQFITLAPNYPALLDNKGLLNWGDNTLYINPISNTQRPYNAKTNNLISNALINYSITSDLKVRASIGYTILDRREFASEPLNTFSPALGYGPSQRRSYFTDNSANNWNVEAQADWSKKLGAGKLDILMGLTFQENLIDGQEIRGEGYTSDALMANISSASTFGIAARSYLQYRYIAAFGRLNYSYRDKYILNATGRRDGSSRFGLDRRFANFGAIGAAWIISGENFMKSHLTYVSLVKLRGSFGITGNDQVQDYGYLELWRLPAAGNYQGVSTMAPIILANPNYSWEKNKKAEIALELKLLKDRVNFTAAYYSNRSSSLLLPKLLPPSTGFVSITHNLPAAVSNTGWELELNTNNISNKVFTWSTVINLTIPKNRLIDYPGLESSSEYVIGRALSTKKIFTTKIDSQTGLYIMEDRDNDGIIDFEKDRSVQKFIGREFYGGLQNIFSYKGIELDFTIQFVKQSGPSYLGNFNQPGIFSDALGASNQPVEFLDRWQNPVSNSKYQKYSTGSDAYLSNYYAGTLGSLSVDNASFVRLKNVSVSYGLSQHLLNMIKVKNARFFIQGQNLFTITPYKGLDPETLSVFVLPTLQVFTAGIQLTL